jgi:CelD/BcsL family acetyltransferase involved in cellulose biosynthesis
MDLHGDIMEFDPCGDARWLPFVSNHARATVFHRVSWLEALRQTYGFRTIALGRVSSSGALSSGVLLCEIRSWLTGNRLVSLPFSDHCEPLVENPEELRLLLAHVSQQRKKRNWRYIEIRPVSPEYSNAAGGPYRKFVFHRLDLRPTTEELFRKLHVDSIRRKIQKAEKSGLTIRSGRSDDLLADFFRLHVLTRKRQLSPPHPIAWFRNVLKCLGESACIRIAYVGETPAAAVFTLESEATVVYKYGCSDEQFHRLGAMPFVFWDMIREAKGANRLELDMGRSDLDNPGLITFKERWGAQGQPLIYSRLPAVGNVLEHGAGSGHTLQHLLRYCPDWLLISAGKMLYPHIG